MYITPLKVYTSIFPSTNAPPDSSHRISIINANNINIRTLRDISIVPPMDINLPYADCQYTSKSRLIYNNQLEDLVNTVFKGYQSAGICINNSIEDRNNDPGLKLIEKLIGHLKFTLINENERRKKSTLPPIIVLAGLIGFCDEYVHDYYTNTKMKHDHKIDSDLINYLHPLKNVNKLLELIELVPQQTPSILTIDITDGNELHSRLVWANLPSILSEYSSYNKTTENLMDTIKAWNNAHFDEFIGSKNFAMSTALLKLFDGSYRTMVFNQFNEYIPKLDSNNFIEVLQFTSLLQNIKCSVTFGQFERKSINKNMVEHFENITQMQKKIEVLQIKQDILATSIKEKLHKSIELKEKETKYEIVAETLHNNDLISQAKIERRRITSDWKFAQMKETIRQYKIALVQAETSRTSFESTQKDIEYELEDRQRVSKELSNKKQYYRQHIDQLFAKLQQTKEQLRENEKIAEDGPTKRKLAFEGLHKKWEAIEFYYMNCFEESEKRIEKLKLEKGMLLQEQKKIARLQLQDLYDIPVSRPENNEHSSTTQLSPLLNRAIESNSKLDNDATLFDKSTNQSESNKHSFRVQQLSSSLNNLVVDFNGKKNNGTSLYDKSATQSENTAHASTEKQLSPSLDNVTNVNNKRNNHTLLYDNPSTHPENSKHSSPKQQLSSPLNNTLVNMNDKKSSSSPIKDSVVLQQKANVHLDDGKSALQSENNHHSSSSKQRLLSPLNNMLVDFNDKKKNDTSFKHDIISTTQSENNDNSSIEQQLSPPLNSVTNINEKKNSTTSFKDDTIPETQYEDNEDISTEQQLSPPPDNGEFNFNEIKNKYDSLKDDSPLQQKVSAHIEIDEDQDDNDDDDDDDDDGSLFVPSFDKASYRTLRSGIIKERDSIGIGLFSLKSKNVSKPPSDNDSEESSLIPARPRPPSPIEEKQPKKRKQNSKEKTSSSSSSQVPKTTIRKSRSEDKDESQQPPTLKKKRKLRPNKAIIEELGMSPVLGGYTANFFKN